MNFLRWIVLLSLLCCVVLGSLLCNARHVNSVLDHFPSPHREPLPEISGSDAESVDLSQPGRTPLETLAHEEGAERAQSASLRGELFVDAVGPFVERPFFAVAGVHETGARVVAEIIGPSYLMRNMQPGHWWITAEAAATRTERLTVLLAPKEARVQDISLRGLSITPLFLSLDGQRSDLAAAGGSVSLLCGEQKLGGAPYSIGDCLSFYSAMEKQEEGTAVAPAAVACTLVPAYFFSGVDLGQNLIGVAGFLKGASERGTHVLAAAGNCVVGSGVIEGGLCSIELSAKGITACLASVRFYLKGQCGGSLRVSWEAGSVEGELGNCSDVVVAGLVPGVKKLFIDAPAVEAIARRCNLNRGEELDLGDIECDNVTKLLGAVRAKGVPVRNATVACWRMDSNGLWMSVGPNGWKTNENGEFEIAIEAGEVLLSLARGASITGERMRSLTTRCLVAEGGRIVRQDIEAVLTVPVIVYSTIEGKGMRLVVEDENGGALEDREWDGPEMQVHLPPGQFLISLVGEHASLLASRVIEVRERILVVL